MSTPDRVTVSDESGGDPIVGIIFDTRFRVLVDGEPIGDLLPRDQADAVARWVAVALDHSWIAAHREMKAQTDLLAAIIDVIAANEKEMHYGYGGSTLERLIWMVDRHKRLITDTLRHAKDFRDQAIIHLKALGLVVEMVGQGHTHAEKNARLRGLSELIESSATRLGRVEFDISRYPWSWGEVFVNDYPMRRQMERIRELEAEVERLKQPPTESTTDDMPF